MVEGTSDRRPSGNKDTGPAVWPARCLPKQRVKNVLAAHTVDTIQFSHGLITAFKQTTHDFKTNDTDPWLKGLQQLSPPLLPERRCIQITAADPSGIWWSTPYADWADRSM